MNLNLNYRGFGEVGYRPIIAHSSLQRYVEAGNNTLLVTYSSKVGNPILFSYEQKPKFSLNNYASEVLDSVK